jgi:hypothetical protein
MTIPKWQKKLGTFLSATERLWGKSARRALGLAVASVTPLFAGSEASGSTEIEATPERCASTSTVGEASPPKRTRVGVENVSRSLRSASSNRTPRAALGFDIRAIIAEGTTAKRDCR